MSDKRMVPIGYNKHATAQIDIDTIIGTGENAEPTSRVLDDPGAQEWQEPATLPDGRRCMMMYHFTADEIIEDPEFYPWDNDHVAWVELVDADYTVAEAATVLSVATPTITLHARKLGIAKRGRDYLFDEADMDALRGSMAASVPGRPRKTSS